MRCHENDRERGRKRKSGNEVERKGPAVLLARSPHSNETKLTRRRPTITQSLDTRTFSRRTSGTNGAERAGDRAGGSCRTGVPRRARPAPKEAGNGDRRRRSCAVTRPLHLAAARSPPPPSVRMKRRAPRRRERTRTARNAASGPSQLGDVLMLRRTRPPPANDSLYAGRRAECKTTRALVTANTTLAVEQIKRVLGPGPPRSRVEPRGGVRTSPSARAARR